MILDPMNALFKDDLKCQTGTPLCVTVHQSVGGPRNLAGVGITA
jgi:hypothetical protein